LKNFPSKFNLYYTEIDISKANLVADIMILAISSVIFTWKGGFRLLSFSQRKVPNTCASDLVDARFSQRATRELNALENDSVRCSSSHLQFFVSAPPPINITKKQFPVSKNLHRNDYSMESSNFCTGMDIYGIGYGSY